MFKKTASRILMLLFALCAMQTLPAQESAVQKTPPPNDIRPMAKSLSPQQKAKLLEYLQHLTNLDTDRQIQLFYEQLNKDGRYKAMQYVVMQKQDPSKPPRATVQWGGDTLRFGRIEEGAVVLDSFVVTNTGMNPYVISDTKTSCDCTVLKHPKFPIMPGESAAMRVEFDSRGKIGQTVAGIVIYDNSSPNLRTILYLSGEVVPRKKPKNPSGE